MDECRTAFEEWMKNNYLVETKWHPDNKPSFAWLAWQAAWNHRNKHPESPYNEHLGLHITGHRSPDAEIKTGETYCDNGIWKTKGTLSTQNTVVCACGAARYEDHTPNCIMNRTKTRDNDV